MTLVEELRNMTYGIVLDFARQMGVNRITKKEKDRLNWPNSTL